jgi:hypothetical protein
VNRWNNFLAVWSLIVIVGLLVPAPSKGQITEGEESPDMTITAAMRTQVIEGVLKELKRSYVFPDVAKTLGDAISGRVQAKEYDNITSAKALADTLTGHLQAVSHDKHLRVRYSDKPLSAEGRRRPSPAELEKRRRFIATRNFGFEHVERLDGNVGYLDLRGFASADDAGETAAAAMSFLANTDALIIDLRQNGGGDPAMVALLCSYLFDAEPVHLNDLYFRPANETHQWWTLPYLPGKRYLGKAVYVLTSKKTFSAAEEFTYNLKNLKRATIVGETTGGGAHPGGSLRLNDHFAVFVPSGRAINPISKTNWEGTGVKPDIEVAADQALKTAHVEALKKVTERWKGEPEMVASLKKALQKAQNQ